MGLEERIDRFGNSFRILITAGARVGATEGEPIGIQAGFPISGRDRLIHAPLAQRCPQQALIFQRPLRNRMRRGIMPGVLGPCGRRNL